MPTETTVVAPRPPRPETLPLHVKSREEIPMDVKVVVVRKLNGKIKLLIEVDEVDFHRSEDMPTRINLVTVSKQVKERTAEDRQRRRPWNTGRVKGYFGAEFGCMNTPFGLANLQLKLEAVAWLPRTS